MKTYVERLRELREDNDLGQRDVAEFLSIRQNVYTRYENGNNEMQIHTLIPLARFYKTSTDYLLGLTDEKNPYPPSK